MLNEELLLSYCTRRCSEEEKGRIEALMNSSEEVRTQMRNLMRSLRLLHDAQEFDAIDTEASYRRIRKKIRKAGRVQLQSRLMRYAAFLAIPLLLSVFLLSYLYFARPSAQLQYAEVRAALGTIVKYSLPDGSVVWLNGGTLLKYPTNFQEKERVVELEGEGYFEVTADITSPFYVKTAQGVTVYVYGTKFNVNAYTDEDFVEVVLEEGKLNLLLDAVNKSRTLTPGEVVTYTPSSGTFKGKPADVYEKTAWKDGKMIFRNATLKEMFTRLSRRYNVDIILQNDTIDDYKYYATFKDETLEQILNYIGKTAKMEWCMETPLQEEDERTRQKIFITFY